MPVRNSNVISSTPIRKSNAAKSLSLYEVKEKTFSHILLDWQSKCSDKNKMSDQDRVIELVKSGVNVFCTGGAGTGKSHLLKKLVGTLTLILTLEQYIHSSPTLSGKNLTTLTNGGTCFCAFLDFKWRMKE